MKRKAEAPRWRWHGSTHAETGRHGVEFTSAYAVLMDVPPGTRVCLLTEDELADLDKAKRRYDEARQDARDAIAAKAALAQPGRAKWPRKAKGRKR